jgi:predicted signal transduction protein with EAL and GGDEF domain
MMSKQLKITLTIFGPLVVLFTAMLDPRFSAVLAATALVVFGIWIAIDLRNRDGISRNHE